MANNKINKLNIKSAFVSFFPVFPCNMGSAAVVKSRFENWPYKKKLFQFSHLKKINNSNTRTLYLSKESPFFKIFLLPRLIIELSIFFRNYKKKLIIIEGASWIFYSFIIIFFSKILIRNIKIIYISHAIESEIRKKFSNFLIYQLTKILEYLVLNLAGIFTTVSRVEQKKIKKIYGAKCQIFPNSISIPKHFKKFKKKYNNYIIFSGSYKYKPNKEAIDYLNFHIMPKLLKFFPKIKLLITGGDYHKKFPWLINHGLISKEKLYFLIKNSLCSIVPLNYGSGTRIKILENLCLGNIVVSSRVGIEGIILKRRRPPFIYKKSEIISILKQVIERNKFYKNKSLKDKRYYIDKYSMKNNINFFIKKNNNFLNA